MARLKKRPADRDIHPKSWGHEVWVANNADYCGKLLVFDRAHSGTSMHFHVQKLEDMLCLKGRVQVDYLDTSDGTEHSFDMSEGESVQIPRSLPHRLTAREDGTVVVEFSTTHYESDSHRIGPRLGAPLVEERCESCSGKGGRYDEVAQDQWYDCEFCKGQGTVIVKS